MIDAFYVWRQLSKGIFNSYFLVGVILNTAILATLPRAIRNNENQLAPLVFRPVKSTSHRFSQGLWLWGFDYG